MGEKKRFLAVDKCHSHGYMAVSISDEIGGTRLTNGKCCGRWNTVKQWPVTDNDIKQIIKTLGEYLTEPLPDVITAAESKGLMQAAGILAKLAKEAVSTEMTTLLGARSHILAAIPLSTMEKEVCEWKQEPPMVNEWVSPGCSGEGVSLSCIPFRFCPYCGKPLITAS